MISSNFDVCGRAEISAENSFRLIYRKVKAKLRTCLESWNGKMSKKIEAFDGNSHFKMKNLRCVHNRPTRRPSRIARELRGSGKNVATCDEDGLLSVSLSVCDHSAALRSKPSCARHTRCRPTGRNAEAVNGNFTVE